MGENKGNNRLSRTQKSNNNKHRNNKKGNEKLMILVILVVVLVAIGSFIFRENNSSNSKVSSGNNSSSETSKTNAADIVAGIEIKKDEVTEKAKFYSYEVDGIKMEILAIKAKDGTVRTALNTCQVCYASGRGYYVQVGNELECQNCGNRFASSKIGITKGGCNPVPIPDKSKADDDKVIKIDKTYLDKNKAYFSNWKS